MIFDEIPDRRNESHVVRIFINGLDINFYKRLCDRERNLFLSPQFLMTVSSESSNILRAQGDCLFDVIILNIIFIVEIPI